MGNGDSIPVTSQDSSVLQSSAGGSGRGQGKNPQQSKKKDHELREQDKTDGESDEENQAAEGRNETTTGLLTKQPKYIRLSGNILEKGGGISDAVKGGCTTEPPTNSAQARRIYRVDALIPVTQTKKGGNAKTGSIAYKLATQMTADFHESKLEFVAGHLISQSLGGLGDDSNLAVMTRSCNTLYFCRFEQIMMQIKTEFQKNVTNQKPKIHIRVVVTRYEIWRGNNDNIYYFPAEFQVNVNLVDCTKKERQIFGAAVERHGREADVKRFRPRKDKKKGWIVWFLNEKKSTSTNELKTEIPGPCVK